MSIPACLSRAPFQPLHLTASLRLGSSTDPKVKPSFPQSLFVPSCLTFSFTNCKMGAGKASVTPRTGCSSPAKVAETVASLAWSVPPSRQAAVTV